MSENPYASMGGAPLGMPGMPGAPMPQPQPAPTKGKRGKGKAKDAGSPDKPPTRRAVKRQFVVAAIFALVAGGAVTYTVTSAGPQGTYVVRTKAGVSPGLAIDGANLEAVQLPLSAIEPNTITDAAPQAALDKAVAALKGVVPQFPLAPHTQIHPDQFGAQLNLGQPLAGTERLMSIHASVGTSVAGMIKPGDRVDIIGTKNGGARLIATNVPIVTVTVSEDRFNSVADAQSADKDVKASDVLPGDPVPGIYVIRVPGEKVTELAASDASAPLYLVLRPQGDKATDVVAPDITGGN